MTIDLTKAAAYSEKTPYDVWQDQDGIPICHGVGIDELKTLELGPWQRKAKAGALRRNRTRSNASSAPIV